MMIIRGPGATGGVFVLCCLYLLREHHLDLAVEALHLERHWRASKGSILTAAIIQTSNVGVEVEEPSHSDDVPILVTGGHADSGRIRCWNYSSDDHLEGKTQICEQEIHRGSIFSLMAWRSCCRQNTIYLVSGSFDRSAAIHRADTDWPVTFNTIGRLPEHTGWVRRVEAVEQRLVETGEDAITLLSIGCNFINLWTVKKDGEVCRTARLDAGPSPCDPVEETFRRHDILAFATIGLRDNGEAKWIVAGLVDGTIRVFKAEFEGWMKRRENSPYDATGSCDCFNSDEQDANDSGTVEDEKPILATSGHAGRITNIHCIQGFPNDFVSTSYDGTWVRWRINAENKSLSKLVEGSIAKSDEEINEKRWICSSTIITEKNDRDNDAIYFGTSSGCLYRSSLSIGGESEKIYECKVKTASGKDISITALTHHRRMDQSVDLIACRSDGECMLFR